MTTNCIDCSQKLTPEDIAFSKHRQETDIFNSKLFDSITCKACIMNRDEKEDEEIACKEDELDYGEVYSEHLDQEVLQAENDYQGYDTLGELDGGWR